MTKKLNKVEKMIIERTDKNYYKLYRCTEHGVFALRNDVADGACPYKCGFKASEEFNMAE